MKRIQCRSRRATFSASFEIDISDGNVQTDYRLPERTEQNRATHAVVDHCVTEHIVSQSER